MNTVEEIKAAVLAYCESATERSKYASDNDLDWDLEKDDDGYKLEAWGGSISLNFCVLDDASHALWPLAAQILGLEARDAVEAKNAELAESEIAFERQANILQAERALSAKLVEALERTKQYCESGNGRGGATSIGFHWFNEGEGTLYNSVLKALAAYKQGAVQTNHTASTLTRSQQSKIAQVRLAYGRIRTIDQTISDDILDLMKNAAIAAIESEVQNG